MLRKRIVCIKQQDITDCGAACLAMIAWYYNLKYPISKIRQIAKTDRVGTSVLGLIEAAQELGFSAQGVRCDKDIIRDFSKNRTWFFRTKQDAPFVLPAIAHVVTATGTLHYVVIFSISRKTITIADPAIGMRTLSHDEFCKEWTGVLVLLAPSIDFTPGDMRESMAQRLLRIIAPHPALIVEAALCAFSYTILGFATSFYLEYLIDTVLPDGNLKLLALLSIGMLGIMIFRSLFTWAQSSLLIHLSQKVDVMLILGYYRHILSLPQSFFDTRRVGEIISPINDAVKIRVALSSISLTILVDGMVLTIATMLMFTYSWKLACIGLASLPLFMAVFFALRKSVTTVQRRMMEQNAEVESQLISSVSGITTVKLSQAESVIYFKIEQKFVALMRSIMRSSYQGVINAMASEIIGFGAFVALVWLGGTMVIERGMTVGELMSLYTLIAYVTGPASRLVGIHQQVQEAYIAADRIFEILALETEDTLHKGTAQLSPAGIDSIVFHQVSFRYGSRSAVLQNINLTIPRGTMCAIVGESGSGKSTIAKLLQGLYEPSSGSILLGGASIQEVSLESLRSCIATIPQAVEIFPLSIIENITIGDSKPDKERAMRICRFIGAETFIEKLPQQWDTVLGEFGADISGGQRQRLAIARALYRSPSILIMDEATSALDSASEQTIHNVMKALREYGLTMIVIAHRLSTIAMADTIVVLQNGAIVEQGTHQELCLKEGVYYELLQRQTMNGNEQKICP